MAANNPHDAFNFVVTIDGVPVASFAECLLPAASIEVIEYREGMDDVNHVRKIPGLVSFTNLTLKRGIVSGASTLTLWDWFSKFASGTGSPTAVTVTLVDAQRNPVIKWSFSNCWPVKYESPVLNAKTSAVAIETLEIAVENVTVSGGTGG